MSYQDEIEGIKRLIKNHHRRLQGLEERKALYGIDTPLGILTEIEDTRAEIEELETRLQSLEQSSESFEDKTEPAIVPATATSAETKGNTTCLWIGLGAVAVVVIIGLVIFIVANNQSSGPIRQINETAVRTSIDKPEPIPINTPGPLYESTPELKEPEDGKSFNINEEVTFQWEGDSLTGNQYYVFIISHKGCEENPDYPGCSDVYWITDRSKKSITRSLPDWFIKEGETESSIDWWVVVSTENDPNFPHNRKPDHNLQEPFNLQPTATVVKSDKRDFILKR